MTVQPFCSVILCWSFTCSVMAITSFLNIFEVTPYMIVSEQDSETSLNRRKPRPPADAASIWIRFVDRNVSGAIGRCWHTLHGNFTPCGSHRLPPLPATAHIVEIDCAGSFPPAAKTYRFCVLAPLSAKPRAPHCFCRFSAFVCLWQSAF